MATKKPMYGYTIADDVDQSLPDQSGGKFDTEKMLRGQAQLVQTPFADRKAMRYLGKGDEPDFDVTKAGAGRGKQGGPTAKELKKYEDKQNEGIFVEGKQVPQDVDSGSAPRKKLASGGMTASRRADGIAQRGKTRGKMC
jgi:hypothetical protein